MIDQIDRIRGHRVFRDFAWPGDLAPFGRYNLIYGGNGSGKTTLAGLFLHLEGSTGVTEGEVGFTIGGRRVSGAGLATEGTLPPVRVFTRKMTASSVLEGGTGLNPVYYLGRENVAAQQELKTRSEELASGKARLQAADAAKQKAERELDRFCVTQAKNIKELLTGTKSPYNTYDKKKFSAKCAVLAAEGGEQRPLSPERKTELRRLADGSAKESIPEVALAARLPEALAPAVRELLARTVVSQVIDGLARHPKEAEWVREGLSLHAPNAGPQPCKFCGNMVSQERLRALEGHFNDQYNRLIREIDAAKENIAEALRLVRGCQLPDPARFYDNLAEEYKEAREAFVRSLEAAGERLEKLSAALSAKREKPFESLDLENYAPGGECAVDDAVHGSLSDINDAIAQHNQQTQEFEGIRARARETLEKDMVSEALPEHRRLQDNLGTATSEAVSAADHVKSVGQRVSELRALLIEHQTPADELNRELRSFLGRDDLKLDVHGGGYTVTRGGEPAAHLSEGEKTAIAFLHFLKSLGDSSFKLEEGIVVIDDPISSLDSNALFNAFGFMKARTEGAGQLFVLTHNFHFFSQVKRWFCGLNRGNRKKGDQRPASFYMLTRTPSEAGDTARLTPLPPLLEKYESEYHLLFKRVLDAAEADAQQENPGTLFDLPNVARRLLETFFAFRFPGVHDFTQCMSALPHNQERAQRILRFVHMFSHGDRIAGEEHDPSLVTEAPAIMADIMKLIESEDPRHHQEMVRCVRGDKSAERD